MFLSLCWAIWHVPKPRARISRHAAIWAARQAALQDLDTFFVQLLAMRHLDTNEVDCLLVSPCPPSARAPVPAPVPSAGEAWEQLTPVMALGPDFPPGLLASPTTRTAGLVAGIDLAPTILRLVSVPVLRAMQGQAMQSQPAPNVQTARSRQFWVGNSEERQPYLARLDFISTLNMQAWACISLPWPAAAVLFLPARSSSRRGFPGTVRAAQPARWLSACSSR